MEFGQEWLRVHGACIVHQTPHFPLRIGELFCGPGGLALGASQAKGRDGSHGFIHAWASDIDRSSCDTYAQNIPGATRDTVICRPIRDLDFTKLSPIDCLAFGFPCNDFSIIGTRKGIRGRYGSLYRHGVDALQHFQPGTFLAENAGGLSSANGGRALAKILKELVQAGPGYNVWPHLYRAEEYGVAQKRRRILIVGTRNPRGRSAVVVSTPATLFQGRLAP